MLIRAFGVGTDMHVNPNYIVKVWKLGKCYYATIHGENTDKHIDKDSYDRIVEWMEKHDG